MRHARLVVLFLIIATGAVYWQVGGHAFIEFDDDRYVFENHRVQTGLTWEGVRWALTATDVSNWHPLTWVSHMLDGQLYGSSPRGHHLTNLAFHIANAILLFLLLNRMTRALWRSAFVAALFALHPLHVESVAWVSERKDVLSTLFWWLSLWLYVDYAESPRLWRYLLALLAFALGLMAKSMLVTLPFTLLLLDYWPLRRLEFEPGSLWRRFREKIPFFILAAIASVVTVYAQRSGGALIAMDRFSLDVRVANALLAYATYIVKLIWPYPLAAYYPHPVAVPLWPALGAALLLLGLSAGVIRFARRHPYLLVGWCWYLGTLLPVIGLVQVGSQAMADRYTYVPLVGLFIMLAWGTPEFLAGGRRQKLVIPALAVGALAALTLCTWLQAARWRDTVTLFRHTLEVTDRNSMAHGILGTALGRRGELDEAIVHYRAALRLKPDLAEAHNNLGIALHRKGQMDEAMTHYREALRLKPDHLAAHTNLGAALYTQGRLEEAIAHYREALRSQPRSAEVHNNLATALDAQGRVSEAIRHYEEALRIKPNDAKTHKNLGITLYQQQRFDEAIVHFAEALRINPDDASLRAVLRQATDRRDRMRP
jgi:Flp pilus assembly protein TadD